MAFAEVLLCSSFFRDIAPRLWVMGAQRFITAWYFPLEGSDVKNIGLLEWRHRGVPKCRPHIQ
jgi:hypothetical protein